MQENYDSNQDSNSTPNPQNFTMRDPTPEEQAHTRSDDQYPPRYQYRDTPAGYNAMQNTRQPSSYSQPQYRYDPHSTSAQQPSGAWQQSTQPEHPQYTYSTSNGWQQPPEGGKPPRKKGRGLKVVAVVLGSVFAVALVVFAGIGVVNVMVNNVGTDRLISSSAQEAQGTFPEFSLQNRPENEAVQLPGGALTTQQIVKQVEPSVVAITTYANIRNFQASGMGSGIVISEDGYIVTNAHVVQGAQGITVQMSNGDSFEARVIGADSKTDLAVIKVDASGLTAATFGNSDQVEVGEKVLAIGNPQSMEFYGSVTQGIVSGLERKIVASDSEGNTTSYSNLIQTDAAINPGNSGGALVNEFGQVIGINSAKVLNGSEGIGFAIPSNDVKPVINDLIQHGYVTGRVRMGITIYPINAALAQMSGVRPGLMIQSTEQGSDISQKGVVPGDIITAIDGVEVQSTDDVSKQLEGKKPGDTVAISVYRAPSRSGQQAREFTVDVALMEDKGASASAATEQQNPQQPDQGGNYSTDDLNDFFRNFFQ